MHSHYSISEFTEEGIASSAILRIFADVRLPEKLTNVLINMSSRGLLPKTISRRPAAYYWAKLMVVRINDRGPFRGDRVIDMSYIRREAIGMVDQGKAKVKIELLPKGKPASGPYLQSAKAPELSQVLFSCAT